MEAARIFYRLNCVVTCSHFTHSHRQSSVHKPGRTTVKLSKQRSSVRLVPTTRYNGRFSLLSAELLIHSYVKIVKCEMIDVVPRAVSLTLVNQSKEKKEKLQRELLQELYEPDVLEDLLQECELVVSRRKEVVSMVGALVKAEESVLPPSGLALS